MYYNLIKNYMETKKHKNENKHKNNKNTIILPKSYIGQEPIKIKHKRYHSYTEGDIGNGNDNNDQMLENNIYRFNTDRRPKRVSFNKKIQVINIRNYKKENRILYYGKDDEDEEEDPDFKRENKCLLCNII